MTSSPVQLSAARILIVDDNVDAASSLGVLLRLRDAEVEVVHDGPSALARMETFHPFVVLLDLGMPGMDGFEVAQRIRHQARFQDVVLVAQTGWGTEEIRRRSHGVGFAHHLVKPVEFESLIALLSQLLSAAVRGNGANAGPTSA